MKRDFKLFCCEHRRRGKRKWDVVLTTLSHKEAFNQMCYWKINAVPLKDWEHRLMIYDGLLKGRRAK